MTSDEHRRLNPQPGDRLFNYSRTVICTEGDKVVFGIDIDGARNCGAYSTTLEEWRAWAVHSYDEAMK